MEGGRSALGSVQTGLFREVAGENSRSPLLWRGKGERVEIFEAKEKRYKDATTIYLLPQAVHVCFGRVLTSVRWPKHYWTLLKDKASLFCDLNTLRSSMGIFYVHTRICVYVDKYSACNYAYICTVGEGGRTERQYVTQIYICVRKIIRKMNWCVGQMDTNRFW